LYLYPVGGIISDFDGRKFLSVKPDKDATSGNFRPKIKFFVDKLEAEGLITVQE